MHCNLKPPDVAPVDLGFKYEARSAPAYKIQHFRNLLCDQNALTGTEILATDRHIFATIYQRMRRD